MTKHSILCGAAALHAALAVSAAAETALNSRQLVIPPPAKGLLENYCMSCHEDGTTKGDVRFDNLKSLTLDARLAS